MDFYGYEPIPAENLPSKYIIVFNNITTSVWPSNDENIVLTITGKPLMLVTDNSKLRNPVLAEGYQKAIWELKQGHLRYNPDLDNLWRRDADETDHDGERYILNSWHPVKTIEDEYHIGTAFNDGRRNYAVSATIMREAKRSQWFAQMQTGIRFGSTTYMRKNGKVQAFERIEDIGVTQYFDPLPEGEQEQLLAQAQHICEWLTNDEKSCKNLIRMFATPWLEAEKMMSFILSGHGGDGKSLIMSKAVFEALGARKVFPGFSVAKYCSGGFTLANEGMNDSMDGCAFAYDDETCTVSEKMLPELRSLSTSGTVMARVVGKQYRPVRKTATMVYLTNQPFADSSENADRRRFIKVEMHPAEGRTFEEYKRVEQFVLKYPSAMFLLSARLWEREGDSPEIVNLQAARHLSPEMLWLVSDLLDNEANGLGLVSKRMSFRKQFGKALDAQTEQLLGLESGTKTVNGSRVVVVRVKDRERFNVYRKQVEDKMLEDEMSDLVAEQEHNTQYLLDHPVVDLDELAFTPFDPVPPTEFGFKCDFTPSDEMKIAKDWKKLTENPNVDTTVVPNWSPAYAVVPSKGYLILDMDLPDEHTNLEAEHIPLPDSEITGWKLIQFKVGAYGSAAFPHTYLVRTPSGGVHAYYRIPQQYSGLKNTAHVKTTPVDTRCEGKGYALGVGSKTVDGEYVLIDVPEGDIVPEVTPELWQFLLERGYVEGHERTIGADIQQFGKHTDSPMLAFINSDGWEPDMSLIPKGSRNTELYAWVCGLLANRWEDRERIHGMFFQRGRACGLKDSELEASWRSAVGWAGGLQ